MYTIRDIAKAIYELHKEPEYKSKKLTEFMHLILMEVRRLENENKEV